MKRVIYLLIFFLLFSSNLSPAFESNPDTNDIGKGGRDDTSFLNNENSNFIKGNNSLKKAIKLKKKNKIEKAKKRLEKALNYFVLAYQEAPENVEILNLLGFTYYLVGDSIMSEIYFLEGLKIDPNNNLINQRLGVLYFNTKRISLAEERLKILSNCNCNEYSKLKKIISGTATSQY